MAKNSKSLLNKTPIKQKKSRSKRQTTDNSTPYKFEIGDNLIYCGSLSGYENSKCKVIGKSRKYIEEYYRIKFDGIDDEIETIADILKTEEEFKKYQEENKSSQINEDMLDNSLENSLCCHDPSKFGEMRCMDCLKEPRCVYRYKHNYKKLNIW